MKLEDIKPNIIVRGPMFPEPVQVITTTPMGDSVKLIGKGLNTGKVHEPILSPDQIEKLEANPDKEPFDGDPLKFRLAIEAMRLGLAYEYDPYFSLSIARVDPLPHQLEAVYDYFLKLPRIRFLLADDPGAGKTIMAGLLIKELKIRGLIKRILVVTPANLTFQWQRELKDKFRENFKIIKGDILRANYGANPWQDENQLITSISWISRIDDAKESLLRSQWDLIIVDEAHKMSAYSQDRATLAYRLGQSLSEMTDHYLLMTATPHKGDPENFRLFLELLDKDIYGDIRSLQVAMEQKEAPFYLRRIKEALVSFPDPDTGEVKQLFTKRNVKTAPFKLNADEYEFYNDLTRYVEDQSIKASEDTDSRRGRALGFIMAMLQRRFASSVFAVRRSLERMKEKREKILADPEGYRQEQILKRIPDEFEDYTDEEQQDILSQLEEVVASVDPIALREEIVALTKLIDHAILLEQSEIETKLNKLREVITEQGLFKDPKMKLLLFTEHKDTLTYLVEKLKEWGLSVTQIHGGMNIGDRDTLGTRIYAEREFRESSQILVATEAAGEGINLQFCWFMINYDIPWNPVRLEQRMGRIHRYGQKKDCLIINFVSTNTREGRVMDKLLERISRIEQDLDPKQTGAIFNVLGEIFPANQLERMLREMYVRNLTVAVIEDRIVEQVDTERLRRITHSTLEGLAKRELNLSAIIGKAAEAKERRLVPEVIEDFFTQSAPISGITPKEIKKKTHIYKIGRVPRRLWSTGERLEPRFGKLGHEYSKIIFDKEYLIKDPTLEWVTPGHPLFEVVREDLLETTQGDLRRGAVFYDINQSKPYRLDVYSAAVVDGLGNILHRRIFVMETDMAGTLTVRQPTIFLDIALAHEDVKIPDDSNLPGKGELEQALVEKALANMFVEITEERGGEIDIIRKHLKISLNELINRENIIFAELVTELQEKTEKREVTIRLKTKIKNSEERLEQLNERLERRLSELEKEEHCTISEIQHHGRAWVLPHPERNTPKVAPMVRDDEIERIAVEVVIAHEKGRGWEASSVEKENRGFDLISRKPHSEDPQTAVDVRFIEVKGRAGIGEVGLTSNEYKTAERLKKDYWLYVVFNCSTEPNIHLVQDPAQLGWKPIVKIEHYHVSAKEILAADKKED